MKTGRSACCVENPPPTTTCGQIHRLAKEVFRELVEAKLIGDGSTAFFCCKVEGVGQVSCEAIGNRSGRSEAEAKQERSVRSGDTKLSCSGLGDDADRALVLEVAVRHGLISRARANGNAAGRNRVYLAVRRQ